MVKNFERGKSDLRLRRRSGKDRETKELFRKQESLIRKKAHDGFMTVEASVLLPLASVLYLLLFYMCSYLYQSCFLHQTAYIAAFRGSRAAEALPAQDYTEMELEELLKEELLSFGEEEREVNAGPVLVKVSLEKETPFSGYADAVPGLSVSFQSLVRRPVMYIRGIRKLKEMGDS